MVAARRGVLDGAFVLLEVLAGLGEAGLSQLAEAAELPKTTTHRLLSQLAVLGAVESRAGRYRIGPRMFHVGEGWRLAAALRAAALTPLRQLAATINGASVYVSVPDAGKTLIVATLRGDADSVLEVRPGLRYPDGVARNPVITRKCADAPAVSSVTAPVVHPATGEVIASVGVRVLDHQVLVAIVPLVSRAANMVSANLARLGTANPALVSW